MKILKLAQSNRRVRAVWLGVIVGLAMLFLAVLLWGLREVTPVHADPGILHVDGAAGQDIGTCGMTSTPCKTISYTLNSRASSGDTIRVAQGMYTENLTVDKQIVLEGGYESVGWTRNITQYETIIDGSNSRTVAGDWDGRLIHQATVITDGGKFKMWYSGRNLYWQEGFGLATSSDGITWTKDVANPVFTTTADWEEDGLGHPCVVTDGGMYKMWYGPHDERIGYAWSSDGISWTKYSGNPILEGTPGAWDEDGVGASFVIKVGPTDYRMWYQSSGQIGYATSTNGIDWTKYPGNPVLSPGPSEDWDDEWVADPKLLYQGGVYHMWYAGNDGDRWQIGYAWSADGTNWTRSLSNPVLSPGPSGSWDDENVSMPNVLFDGTTYRMWFTGWDGWGTNRRGYATSPDGVTWTKYPGNPVLTPGTSGQWGQPVVKFVENSSDGSVLDGFTVRNGEAEYGGGVLIDGVQVTVRDCVVTGNNAYYGGGGIDVAWGADAVISNTQVLSNSVSRHFGGGILVRGVDAQADIRDSLVANNQGAEWGGGGVVVDYYASATLVGNEIISNTCPTDGGGGVRVNNHALAEIRDNIVAHNGAEFGGGIRVTDHSTATITSNRLLSNTASGWAGGGILVDWYSVATILSNEIVSNTANAGGGGGIRVNNDSQATIGNNIIKSNSARGAGGIDIVDQCSADVYANTIAYNRVGDWGSGGMSIAGGSVVTVTNNVVVSNVSTVIWYDGDGIAVWGDTTQARLVNNTIAYNSAEGVQTAASCTVLVRNNIIVGNNGGIHDLDSEAVITIDHNDVWDNGWANYVNVIAGTGDISADPLFVDVANGDYHLQAGSPCIDAGTSVGAPTHDIEGTPRDAAPDMGAYEFRSFTIYLPIVLKPVPNLKDLITKVTVTLPQPLEGAAGSFCTWGGCSVSPRLYHEPLADDRTLVGWTDSSGNGHVSVISGDTIERTFDFSAKSIRGLVAHDDGTFAVLLWNSDSKVIWLSKRSENGNEIWTTNLNGDGTFPEFWLGDGRLTYGSGLYVAYFTVKSDSGHYGDQLTYIDDNGNTQEGGWGWGCSHSLAELVGYHTNLDQFVAVCSSDCYPGKGIFINNSYQVYEADGNCAGSVSAQLGQIAPGEGSWKLLFNALDRPCCGGHGIALATIDESYQSSFTWLTNTDGAHERDPAIARLGSDGQAERYLVGWTTTDDSVYWLGVIDGEGNFLAGLEEVTSVDVLWGNRDDSFRTRADGSISWVQGDPTSTELRLFRFDGSAYTP